MPKLLPHLGRESRHTHGVQAQREDRVSGIKVPCCDDAEHFESTYRSARLKAYALDSHCSGSVLHVRQLDLAEAIDPLCCCCCWALGDPIRQVSCAWGGPHLWQRVVRSLSRSPCSAPPPGRGPRPGRLNGRCKHWSNRHPSVSLALSAVSKQAFRQRDNSPAFSTSPLSQKKTETAGHHSQQKLEVRKAQHVRA